MNSESNLKIFFIKLIAITFSIIVIINVFYNVFLSEKLDILNKLSSLDKETAEMVKKQIGSAFPGSEVHEMEVRGRNLSEGIPRTFAVSSNEILEALTDPINQIVVSIKNALENTPPELAADIAERGVVITGGGALLRDLDRLLMEETGLPVYLAEDPLTCVVRGCGEAIDRVDELGPLLATE